MEPQLRVATCLWFEDQAEQAATFYTSLIPDSEITGILRLQPDGPALIVDFSLGGTPFQALNGGPGFPPSEAASITVSTKDQAETDRLWQALTTGGGRESRCAWLQDRYGVSWQIVPEALPRLLSATDREAAERVRRAMMGMNRIIVAELEAAFGGC